MLSVGFLIFTFLISSHTLLLSAQASPTCPLPSGGKSGDKTRVKLAVYNCIQATSSLKPACGGRTVREVILERGKTVNINYDVNGYAVLAKFFGQEVCVSYRKEDIRKGVIVSHEFACDSECFSDEEYETYRTDLYCSYQSCGGGRNKLKFEVRAGAAKFVMRLSVLIGLAVIATGLMC